MLQTPQEIEVWYVLPALRREFALEFQRCGFNQTRIAEILQITKPAVSQYLSNKRATDLEFDAQVKQMIQEASKEILKTKNWMGAIQKILRHLEKEKIICDVHRVKCKDLNDCQVCYT